MPMPTRDMREVIAKSKHRKAITARSLRHELDAQHAQVMQHYRVKTMTLGNDARIWAMAQIAALNSLIVSLNLEGKMYASEPSKHDDRTYLDPEIVKFRMKSLEAFEERVS